jgi:hypothetical protein
MCFICGTETETPQISLCKLCRQLVHFEWQTDVPIKYLFVYNVRYIATDRDLCYFVHYVEGSGLIHLVLYYFMYRMILEYIYCYCFYNVCSTNCNSYTQLDRESCRHVPCELWSVDLTPRCPGMLTAHRN